MIGLDEDEWERSCTTYFKVTSWNLPAFFKIYDEAVGG
jgi:hypothetical protein